MSLSRFDTWIRSTIGPAAAGAQVFLCTQPAVVSTNPTPQAQLYSDNAGLVPISQPLVADGFGHVDCYLASGSYTVVVVYSGSLVLSYPDQAIGVPGVVLLSPSGDQTITNSNLLPAVGNTTQSLGSAGAPWDATLYTTNTRTLNNVRFADQFPGADSAAQINAAIADLPSTGGTVNALAFTGINAWSSNPFANVTKPVTLLTGPATFTYDGSAVSVALGSHVVWIGCDTILQNSNHNHTSTGNGFLANVVFTTTGAIASSSNSLTVANATGIEVDSVVAVLGAAGPETKQATTINEGGGIGAGDTSVTVTSTTGWDTSASSPNNYIQIDSEIMSYSGGSPTTFTGLTRGLLGTTAASHSNGATVSAVSFFVSRATAVAGTTVTLADNASATVSNSIVWTGAQDIHLYNLTVDGGAVSGDTSGVSNLVFNLAAKCEIAPSVLVKNSFYYATAFVASQRNFISGRYQNNSLNGSFGADVLLFSQSQWNRVDTVNHLNGLCTMMIDDRSTHHAVYDGSSNYNLVKLGPVITTATGSNNPVVSVQGGCSYNDVTVSTAQTGSGGYGINLVSTQWTSNPTPHGNVFKWGRIDTGTGVPLSSSGYTASAPYNSWIGGTLDNPGSNAVVAGEPIVYTDNSGFTNVNQILGVADFFSFLRSGAFGDTAHPDIWGDGTHQLVIGGKSDGSGTVSFGATTSVAIPSKITSYNGATTSGNGVPAIVASDSSATLTDNYNAGSAKTIITTPTAGSVYRISGTQQLVRAASSSSTFPSLILGYTDAGGIARTATLVGTSAANSTTVITAFTQVFYVNATSVTLTSASYASSGGTTMEYALAYAVEQLL